MEKIIVYTCITGDYDTLNQPCLPAEGFEFICFVKRGTKRQDYVGKWRIEEIPFDWKDNTLLARSVKLNPHTALEEGSKWSLWIDGNIRLTDSSIYEICRKLQAEDVKYAGILHPYCDCVYEEAVRCLRNRREKLPKLLRIVRFLRKNNVPEHAGLMETNMIFRKHCDNDVIEFDRWWWECLVKYSNRDQLTHMFCLRDTPALKHKLLLPEGMSTRNFPGVEYVPHPSGNMNWFQRKCKFGLNRPETFILRLYIKLTGLARN